MLPRALANSFAALAIGLHRLLKGQVSLRPQFLGIPAFRHQNLEVTPSRLPSAPSPHSALSARSQRGTIPKCANC